MTAVRDRGDVTRLALLLRIRRNARRDALAEVRAFVEASPEITRAGVLQLLDRLEREERP